MPLPVVSEPVGLISSPLRGDYKDDAPSGHIWPQPEGEDEIQAETYSSDAC